MHPSTVTAYRQHRAKGYAPSTFHEHQRDARRLEAVTFTGNDLRRTLHDVVRSQIAKERLVKRKSASSHKPMVTWSKGQVVFAAWLEYDETGYMPEHLGTIVGHSERPRGQWSCTTLRKMPKHGGLLPHWYVPPESPHDVAAELRGLGYSRHEAYTLAMKQTLELRDRCRRFYENEWCYIGVVVTASVEINDITIELAEESLWAIESDSDDAYLVSTVLDLANECSERIKEVQTALNPVPMQELKKQVEFYSKEVKESTSDFWRFTYDGRREGLSIAIKIIEEAQRSLLEEAP